MPFLFYTSYEIETRKKDVKHNKFINWFFVGANYKTKMEKRFDKELDDNFYKKEQTVRDMTNIQEIYKHIQNHGDL
jgi:hypothetical protein